MFALPAFLWLRNLPPAETIESEAPLPWRQALRDAIDLLQPSRNPGLARFLVANLLFMDAVNTVILFMATYARKAIGLEAGQIQSVLAVSTVAAIAAWRAWRAEGGALPVAVAGHSLGEYSALVASGVLTLTQAVPLVRLRAQAMQEAVPVGVGAMAAILGLAADQVVQGCAQVQAELGVEAVVSAANFNDPGQTVIAGSKAAVDKACEVLKAMGAKRTLPLPVSAPFHCALMKPAAERLREIGRAHV